MLAQGPEGASVGKLALFPRCIDKRRDSPFSLSSPFLLQCLDPKLQRTMWEEVEFTVIAEEFLNKAET